MYFGINLPIKKNTKILFDEKLPVPHSKLDQFYNWDNLESLKTYLGTISLVFFYNLFFQTHYQSFFHKALQQKTSTFKAL